MIKPEIKEAVRVLYVEKGYKPSEVSKLTGIDHSTVYDWINNSNWKADRINNQFKLTKEALNKIPVKADSIIQIKKIKAQVLITEKGYNQKETARLIEVSQKTISQWCKKHKWNCSKKEV